MITGKLIKTRFMLPSPDYDVVTRVCKEQGISRKEFYDTYAWNGTHWVIFVEEDVDFPELPTIDRTTIMVTRVDDIGRSVWVHFQNPITIGKFCLTRPYQQELLDKLGSLRVGNTYYVTLEEYRGYTNLVDASLIQGA